MIDANKSKIMQFYKVITKKTDKLFKMENEEIYLVQQYKYLGLLLDEHLKFEPCDNTLAKSGGRAFVSLINKCNVNKYFNSDIFTHLFNTYVSSILLVW